MHFRYDGKLPSRARGYKLLEKNQKVGRNEKCPCGSEKKYKHCCGSI